METHRCSDVPFLLIVSIYGEHMVNQTLLLLRNVLLITISTPIPTRPQIYNNIESYFLIFLKHLLDRLTFYRNIFGSFDL